MPEEKTTGSSLTQKLFAVLVLAVAAWILLKIVVGIVAGIATTIVVVVAIGAVIWALRAL